MFPVLGGISGWTKTILNILVFFQISFQGRKSLFLQLSYSLLAHAHFFGEICQRRAFAAVLIVIQPAGFDNASRAVIQFFNGFRKTIFDRIFVCAAGDRVLGCIPLVRQPFRRGHTFICTTARFIDFDIRTKHSLFHLKNFRRFYVQCFGNFFRFAGTEKLGVVL